MANAHEKTPVKKTTPQTYDEKNPALVLLPEIAISIGTSPTQTSQETSYLGKGKTSKAPDRIGARVIDKSLRVLIPVACFVQMTISGLGFFLAFYFVTLTTIAVRSSCCAA